MVKMQMMIFVIVYGTIHERMHCYFEISGLDKDFKALITGIYAAVVDTTRMC